MADTAQLLDAIRAQLVTAAIVRVPGAAGSLPVAWIHPEGGAVAPGDKRGAEDAPDVALSIFSTGGMPARTYEPFLRRVTVDFWFRARLAPFAMELEADVREALIGSATDGTFGKRDWTMGGLHMHATQEWRPLQQVRVDAPGHAFVWSILCEFQA